MVRQTVPDSGGSHGKSAVAIYKAVASEGGKNENVIVSGSDGRASEWKHFWSQLYNLESVKDRPYVSTWS